jgi:hypothetical protein
MKRRRLVTDNVPSLNVAASHLIDTWGLIKSPHFHNEIAAYTTKMFTSSMKYPVNIRLSNYGSFLAVTVSLGEVRTSISNGTHLGERGILSASSSIRIGNGLDCGGTGLRGGDLEGLVWRVGACAAKSRTTVREIGDGYIKTEDIIYHLTGLADIVANAEAANNDRLFGWNDPCIVSGWGEFDKGEALMRLCTDFVDFFNSQPATNEEVVSKLAQFVWWNEVVLTSPDRVSSDIENENYWVCGCGNRETEGYIHHQSIPECDRCKAFGVDSPRATHKEIIFERLLGRIDEND